MYFMEKVNMIAFGLSIKRYTNKKSYIRHNDTGKVIICAEDFAEEADAPRILFAVETNSAKKIERVNYDLWTGLRPIEPEILDAADVKAAFDELEKDKDCDGKTRTRHADFCIGRYRNGEVLYVSGRTATGLGNCHLLYKENGNLIHAQFFENELYINDFFGVSQFSQFSDPRRPRHEHNIDVLPMDLWEMAGWSDIAMVDKIMEKGSKRLVSFAGISYVFSAELQPTLFRDSSPSILIRNGESTSTDGFKEIPLTDRIWEIDSFAAQFNLTRIPNNELGLDSENAIIKRAVLTHQLDVARFNLTNSQCVYVTEMGKQWFQELSQSDRKVVLDYARDINSIGREQAMDFMRDKLRRTGNLDDLGLSRIRVFYSLYR